MSAEHWRLLNLGGLEPYGAQTLYEAVALAVDRGRAPNTIILCYPTERYVCIGYHQEVEKEVDLDYCKVHGLPVIRRPVGGGATYLDSGQQFYQVVVSESDPIVPARVDEFFKFFLEPPIYAYRQLGVPAEYKPVNDIVANGRKISGNGAGTIESVKVLIGNIILDIDYDLMARVLKVPDEKFRDKVAKSMREWVSSLKRELGYVPGRDEVTRLLVEGYRRIGIELSRSSLTEYEEKVFTEEVKPRHLSKEWLYMPQYRHPELVNTRAVKVKEGVRVVEADYKADKMIRVTVEVVDEKIRDILISGDFFMLPEEASHRLEEALIGSPLEREALTERVESLYGEGPVEALGAKPADFVEAIMKAAST